MAKVTRSNPKAFEKLELGLKALEGKEARVGWFQSAKYEGGTPVAYVAAIQELGYGPIPARPFMRPTALNQRAAWAETAGQGSKAVIRGMATATQVMDAIGAQAAGDVAKTITEIQSPPLSPITLELRARRQRGEVITGKTVGEAAEAVNKEGYITPNVSKKPLVDQGILLNSLTHETKDATTS